MDVTGRNAQTASEHAVFCVAQKCQRLIRVAQNTIAIRMVSLVGQSNDELEPNQHRKEAGIRSTS
jgi:hypothetical protein